MRESIEIVNDVTYMASLTHYAPLPYRFTISTQLNENNAAKIYAKLNIFRPFLFSIFQEKYMFHIWPQNELF